MIQPGKGKDVSPEDGSPPQGLPLERAASFKVFEFEMPCDTQNRAIRQETLTHLAKDIRQQRIQQESKVLIFMSGLPARGKSFISKKLTRYLRWMGYNSQVFNVGNLRRQRKHQANEHNATFFDPQNQDAKHQRDRLAIDVLECALAWLHEEGGQVAIHDATNSTQARRKQMYELATASADVQVIFIESVCNDPKVIEQNILLKLKSPDYINMDPEKALADFTERLHNYEKVYEPLTDEEGDYAYIRLIDVGKKIVAKNIRSYLPGQICFYLMNMHLNKRPIWLTRHGESIYNTQGRIGGDSELSPMGHKYAKAFSDFIQEQLAGQINAASTLGSPMLSKIKANLGQIDSTDAHSKEHKWEFVKPAIKGGCLAPPTTVPAPLHGYRDEDEFRADIQIRRQRRQSQETPHMPVVPFTPGGSPTKREVVVWTSTLKRATETCSYLPPDFIYNQTAMLNEIYAGRCEGMSYGRIMHEFPLEFLARSKDKLHYRYPGSGESYIDIVERVRPLIIEIERTKTPIVIVGHMSSLRALYAYFMNIPLEDVPYLNMPLNTAICLTELPHGMEEKVYQWRGTDDAEASVWEHVPNFCVNAHQSDARTIHTVAALGHEYAGIPEEEFHEFRAVMARVDPDSDFEGSNELLCNACTGVGESGRKGSCVGEGGEEFNGLLDTNSTSHSLYSQFRFSRNEKRECGWIGCGAAFENHPEFVAHVIAMHCSTGKTVVHGPLSGARDSR